MTEKEAKSCIRTIELLRRLAFNVHGVMDVIDARNCDKIIALLSQEPCEDAVSRKAVLYLVGDYDLSMGQVVKGIHALPSVNPQPKTGHWIEVAKYSDGKHKIECSECGNHIFDRGHANSYNVRKKYKYCPSCGARMIEPQAESEGEE